MFNNIEEYHAFLETQTQLLKNNYLSSKISQMRESPDEKEARTKITVRINEAYALIMSHRKASNPHLVFHKELLGYFFLVLIGPPGAGKTK